MVSFRGCITYRVFCCFFPRFEATAPQCGGNAADLHQRSRHGRVSHGRMAPKPLFCREDGWKLEKSVAILGKTMENLFRTEWTCCFKQVLNATTGFYYCSTLRQSTLAMEIPIWRYVPVKHGHAAVAEPMLPEDRRMCILGHRQYHYR